MLTSDMDCDEEDEDVVIAGSELHEALSKMGYSDYEVAPVSNRESSTPSDLKKSDGWSYGILHQNLFNIHRCIVKDSNESRKQLAIISGAQHLLDDHADFIKSLLNEDSEREMRGISRFLTCLQYAVVTTTVGYCFVNRSNPISWVAALPALTAARYKYNKWRSNRDLKRLISEQTELYYSYKRALRVLSHSFRMNTSPKQSGSKFTDIGAEKLKFLQPITERTVQSLGTMSLAYYQTTLKTAELLPDLYRRNFDSQITYFDRECFRNCGEITYNSLKQIFYRFILIQSEMLLSFAVLRHSDPDDLSNDMKRGIRVDHRVKQLLELTIEHRIAVMKTVDDFHKHKLSAVEDKYRGFPGSKWQDLYVRLHLTSHKVQKAYDTIASSLEEIENHLDRRTDETELVEILKTRMDEVYHDVDKARDLAQLSALIISKMGGARENGENKLYADADTDAVEISRRNITVVRDTDPVIIDEVFEEYIRERYSEVILNETGDDYLEKSNELDKLLSKNLMSELKEALVDKQRDTRERESRALKRMNKSPNEETAPEDLSNGNPSLDLDAEIESSDSKQRVKLDLTNGSLRDESETGERKLSCIPRPPPMRKELNRVMISGLEKGEEEAGEIEDRRSKSFGYLPSSGSIPLPLFLSNNEETFVGSGENSEEEVEGERAESDDEEEEEEEDDEGNCDL